LGEKTNTEGSSQTQDPLLTRKTNPEGMYQERREHSGKCGGELPKGGDENQTDKKQTPNKRPDLLKNPDPERDQTGQRRGEEGGRAFMDDTKKKRKIRS